MLVVSREQVIDLVIHEYGAGVRGLAIALRVCLSGAMRKEVMVISLIVVRSISPE